MGARLAYVSCLLIALNKPMLTFWMPSDGEIRKSLYEQQARDVQAIRLEERLLMGYY